MNLKIVEVLVLLLAGILFVIWQFRDLRRAKEITRLKRETEKHQAMQRSAKPEEGSTVTSKGDVS